MNVPRNTTERGNSDRPMAWTVAARDAVRNCRLLQRPALLLLAVCLATAVGCGGKFDARVSGTVTLDGDTLERGTVVFNPTSSGPSAYGRIESDGTYTLKVGADPTLPPGDYIVTVAANEPSAPPTTPGAPPIPGPPITPAKYRNKQTSDLKKTVEKGKNTIDLELKSGG
jgi:hypothetical protein